MSIHWSDSRLRVTPISNLAAFRKATIRNQPRFYYTITKFQLRFEHLLSKHRLFVSKSIPARVVLQSLDS